MEKKPGLRRAQASLETLVVLAALAAFLAVVLPASLRYQSAFEDLTAVQQAQSFATKLATTSVAVAGLGPGASVQVDAYINAPVTLQANPDASVGGAELVVQLKTQANPTTGVASGSATKTLAVPNAPAPTTPIAWLNATNHVSVRVHNDVDNPVTGHSSVTLDALP